MVQGSLVQISKTELTVQRVEGIGNALEQRRSVGQSLLLSLLERVASGRFVAATCGLQHRTDTRSQLTLRIRLRQVTVRALLEALDALLIESYPRDQQHRNHLCAPHTAQGL